MTSKTHPLRGRVPTDPAQLPENERAYYRAVWGFDPVGDCLPLAGGGRRYEACLPLTHDPPLQAIGVTICARVDWQGGAVHNRIVFRRGAAEAAVECTHTLVYAGPATTALTFATDAYTLEGTMAAPDRVWLGKAGGPVPLPPWEHFAALKSYVAAVAEVGISAMVRSTIPRGDSEVFSDTPEVPFGFNSLMQSQIFASLSQVAPDASYAMQRDFIHEFLDVASPVWIMERWVVLTHKTPLLRVLLNDVDLLVDWVSRWGSIADPPFTEDVLRKDLGKILTENWEKVIRSWKPALVIKLFRMINFLDDLQARLFAPSIFHPQDALILQAREIAPDVPWDQLQLEWQARERAEFYFAHETGHPLYLEAKPNFSKLEVNLNQMPPVELWPRKPLCNSDVPSVIIPRPSQDDTIAVLSERVTQFYCQVKENPVFDDFTRQWTEDIKDHSSLLQSLPEFWDKILTPSNFPVANFQPARIHDPLSQVYETARHPRTPVAVLRELASHWDLATRLAIVAHSNADLVLLQELQQDIQPGVRAIAEARMARETPVIAPLPGEVLTPGEVLWLMVENEGATLLFGVLRNMRGGREYRKCFRKRMSGWKQRENHRRRAEGDDLISRKHILGRVFFWSYWRGFIFTQGDAEFVALSGLRNLACGDFPCQFLGYYSASSAECISYRESLLLSNKTDSTKMDTKLTKIADIRPLSKVEKVLFSILNETADYPYNLRKKLHAKGISMGISMIYKILKVRENEGFVERHNKSVNSRTQTFYTLTPQGYSILQAEDAKI